MILPSAASLFGKQAIKTTIHIQLGCCACRKAVADIHDDDVDSISGQPIRDRSRLQALYEEIAIADAVYESSAREMAQACTLHQRDILAFEKESDHFKPAFATAIRPDHKQVLLVVRGTQTLSDALTNLTGKPCCMCGPLSIGSG